MKKTLLLIIAIILSLFASAQTQRGYVKTKGRMVNGKLVPGQGLKGASISVHGRSAVLVNAADGAFSFPVTEAQFRVDSVRKKDYQLIDMDAIGKTYNPSANPIYLVMEMPEQQQQDQLMAERKIRRNLQRQLQEKEDEIENLKAKQQISDEEYRTSLQKLYQDQQNNEQLIKDMAKRYSELDYDQLDDFYRQVSYCIENGELVKADSLLNTKGDVSQQVEEQLRKGQAIQEQEVQLNQAKAVHAADQEELARRCYGYYETFAAQHLNDTAAYYLELRASLDTTNEEWQIECGLFINSYLADYNKAFSFLQRALDQSIKDYGEANLIAARCYGNMGNTHYRLGHYDQALECHERSINIRKDLHEETHPDMAKCYNNIGIVYYKQSKYDEALFYLEKALKINFDYYGEKHSSVAKCLSNIGLVYFNQENYDKASECFNKALAIRLSLFGEDHQAVASSYNNLGLLRFKQNQPQEALEYYNKASQIRKKILVDYHPDVAQSYYMIAEVYEYENRLETSLEYLHNALSICERVFDSSHPSVLKIQQKISEIEAKLEEQKK